MLVVVAVWTWACVLFYLRWKKLSRLESGQAYRPDIESQGRVTSQWSDNITHLVCQEVKLTIKAANALAKGVPIVTPLFFEDFATNMGSQQVWRHYQLNSILFRA